MAKKLSKKEWRAAQARQRAEKKLELIYGLAAHQVFVDFHNRPFAYFCVWATMHLLPCTITKFEVENVAV